MRDIYGDGGNGRDAKHARQRREAKLNRRPAYKQVVIKGANHRFTNTIGGKNAATLLVNAVVGWLKEQARDQR